jgi:dihydrofolate reductase
MRKIIHTSWISLDGFVAGPSGEFDWVLGDSQLANYELGMVAEADSLLLGKNTYLEFSQYWSAVPESPHAMDWEKEYAKKFNVMPKVVVSRNLQPAAATWGQSDVWRGLDPAKVEALKAGSGGSILMYGSTSIAQQLIKLGLLDELQLLVHPVLLGIGKRLFDHLDTRAKFTVADTERWDSGIVKMVYRKA